MARKRKTYTADEMKAVRERLKARAASLQSDMALWLQTAVDFDLACLIRDAGQQLVCTLAALDTIETSIKLAEMKESSGLLPFNLADCGLEE